MKKLYSKEFKHKSNPKGFTLVEVLAALLVFSSLLFFFYQLTLFFQEQNKIAETKQRMDKVLEQVKAYYLLYQTLPLGTGPDQRILPIGANGFDLEQKFRLDGWGQFFEYVVDPGENSCLQAIVFENRQLAGLLISRGPNQILEIEQSADSPPVYTLATQSDDLVLPLALTDEALQITLSDLERINEKVETYGEIFLGVDNDQDGIIDEDECESQQGGSGGVGCLPSGGFSNDPNCGRATIGNCPTALDNLLDFYDLRLDDTDPWGRDYQWGGSDLFFSMGPDGVSGTTDDIIN